MDKYLILEVANCHGGDMDYLLSLIDEFKNVGKTGIKFQPLHPDKIATPDFAWYDVYKQLYFDIAEWGAIIEKSIESKEVWLDIFDTYGVSVYSTYNAKIKGVKLQPSILYNQAVIDELSKIELAEKVLIINISALELGQIAERIKILEAQLKPAEIWLEVGFQSYPTELIDSALIKIGIIKETFKRKIVFADHADGKGEDAIWLPIMAAMQGADIIEKHILHSSLETKYDFYSSIPVSKFTEFQTKLGNYLQLLSQPFINSREKTYLNNSIQIPIIKRKLVAGTLVNTSLDIDFKRSGQLGLNTLQVRDLQHDFHILSNDVEVGVTLKKENFKKATIATIIACRLKSSRLEKKALLKIGELSSVETCLKSCLQFSNTHYTVLATSTTTQDEELKNYTYNNQVVFHQGDPEDVIHRYLDITRKLNIDIVIRVTADMPFVSKEITEVLLKSHFEHGADYTVAKNVAVGMGVEIMNVSALERIKKHFISADYSEYMTWYFQNNPEHFKLNFVELSPDLVRDYRLTLDYQEDLDVFNAIQKHLDDNKLESNLKNIFDFLDKNSEINALNSHISLKYRTDKKLIDTLNKQTKIH